MNNLDLSETFRKLMKDKRSFAIVVIGLIGMVLILFSSFSESEEKVVIGDNTFAELSEENEKKLTALLSQINGAGKVKAMITYESSEETVFAADTDEDKDDGRMSMRREHIIIDTQQEEGGLITKKLYPRVRGVAVVCDGGENPIIKEQIISVVSALFDISSNKITVADMAD